MRLVAQIGVHVTGSMVERAPTMWEKVRRGFGAKLDLTTDQVRVELEATVVVDQIRGALGRLGVTNALSLVVDDTVVFQDIAGKAGDLPDLVLALADHASIFGRGFKELRFAVEHEEVGLHLVIESRARTHHRASEPAAIVSLGGRLRALEPRPGEEAEAYRQRVEPLTREAGGFEAARLQFESFVARFEDALRAAMPEARVEPIRAEARLVRPTARAPQAPAEATREVTHPAYDPFPLYYPSPVGMVLDAMVMSSLMHAMMPSPYFMVTSPAGAPFGSLQEVAADPGILDTGPAAEAALEDREGAFADEAGDSDGGGDLDDGDGGAFEDGADGGGGDGGGGFEDGGDFGGGDD
jgi:hypothetical protein